MIVPLATRLLLIVRLLLGILTIPLPFALSSKLELLLVVVIWFPLILISSNSASLVTMSLLFAVKVPDAVKLPVELIAPLTDVVPVIFVVPRLLVPFTVKLLSICKLLEGIKILPVPFARNSKSALDAVVVIKFVSIKISSTSTSLTYKFFHCSASDPKLKVSVVLGIKSEFILATMVMFTLEASPKVMFPPINASPATFNDPSKSTSSFNTIKLEALSKFKSPLVDDKVLPVSLKFPVSTLDPFIKVVLDPSVNVAPSVRFILSSFAEKFTVPVSCSTWNKFPTLKSPL